MHNKYRIGFITFTIISILILAFVYHFSSTFMIRKFSANELQKEEKSLAISTDGQATKEECFYLMKLNEYVVVYNSDRKTIFEYTDIVFEELPNSLKTEIKNGKYIKNIEELYGFLENYSS